GWAIVAAFGDGLPSIGRERAKDAGLDADSTARLEQLGTLVNYNAYGETPDDLHLHPATLYRELCPYSTPQAFLDARADLIGMLDTAYRDDMAAARAADVIDDREAGRIVLLPDSACSRRVSGVFGNALAQEAKDRAHAVLTRKAGGYMVSVRAPVSRRSGADTLCLGFEGGGGRAGAAGINMLPNAELPRFIETFRKAF
ncbi:MAG: DHH family phosphoesterase, partial [Pacificimonas sp.]